MSSGTAFPPWLFQENLYQEVLRVDISLYSRDYPFAQDKKLDFLHHGTKSKKRYVKASPPVLTTFSPK
jgi:hypothetical protein